jgi:hypothetical protein
MLTLALTVLTIGLLVGALTSGRFGDDREAYSRDDCRLRDGH